MALQAAITATAHAGETLAALVWRVLGRSSGAVEQILDANPGLALIAEALPEGTVITIPAAADAAAAPDVVMVQLWD
ncbi:MAG: phage tail protein [Caulobacteraceae bacterium]|nr:phage tail protein [Caulobacteraceae bacterium]